MIDLTQIKTIAVVGASNNPEKYGYKISQNLLNRGFEVFPINPKEEIILEQKVYPSLQDMPQLPDLVDIVVPSEIGVKVVREAVTLGIKNLWVQPGAESEEIIEFLSEQEGINYVVQSCIMMN